MVEKKRPPKTGLGFISRRTQKYYIETRPKKIIYQFLRERFYFPSQMIKRLYEATKEKQSFYLVMIGKTWNGIELHLKVQKRITTKGMEETLIHLQVTKEYLRWECAEKNHPDFWGLLFLCFLRWPKNNLVERLRLGRKTFFQDQRFEEHLLVSLKKEIPLSSSSKLPFDLEKGFSPSPLLHFWNTSSKRLFLQSQNILDQT